MPTGPTIILTIKVLVAAVTVLLAASLVALAAGKPRWHGRINTVFFTLTMLTIFGFEIVRQFVDLSSLFDDAARRALRVHLWFAVPSAVLLPAMFLSGVKRFKRLHRSLAIVFVVFWTGTFITGIFFLPHQ